MKNKLVVVPNTKNVIQPSNWAKKDLAEFHIEMTALCGFGCRYCSSNTSRYLVTRSPEITRLVIEQTGERLTPKDNPELAYVWSDPVAPRLAAELAGKPKSFGKGKVLALSQMTDAFAPVVDPNDLEAVIKLLIERTSFRIRILTKSVTVASPKWLKILKSLGDQVVVSLSIGSLDNAWSSAVEIGTSNPRARLNALRKLQDEGIPTFGMLCPVFPQMIESGELDALIEEIRPQLCEYVWAEPYNDRANWRAVRDGHPVGSNEYEWFERCFGENKDKNLWSSYATKLYTMLRASAEADGWLVKLKYMLYELDIRPQHVPEFGGLEGVLLQALDKAGNSKNPAFAELQANQASKARKINAKVTKPKKGSKSELAQQLLVNTIMSAATNAGLEQSQDDIELSTAMLIACEALRTMAMDTMRGLPSQLLNELDRICLRDGQGIAELARAAQR